MSATVALDSPGFSNGFGHTTGHNKVANGNFGMDDDDDGLTFDSPKEEASYYRDKYRVALDLLNETRAELDEFQVSSRELEQELEKELEATENKQGQLKERIQRLEVEKEEWKTKYLDLHKRHTTTATGMQREIDSLRTERDQALVNLRDTELGNDELESRERVARSSYDDMESKYYRTIEEKTLLEQELIQKQGLEEDCQRLKDDLRDANSEIAILRDQLARSVAPTPPASNAPISPAPEKHSHSRSSSRSTAASPSFTEQSSSTERSSTTERSDRSTTVTPRMVRPSPRIPRTTSIPAMSPSISRTAAVASPSAIPSLSRSTTSRALASGSGNLGQPPRRPTYQPSPARAASHNAAKTKGFKLLHDLQARLKVADDRIGTRMPKRNVSMPTKRQPAVSNASSTAGSSAASGASHARVSALSKASAPAVTPGTDRSSVGLLSPTSWVLLSDVEDTPPAMLQARTSRNEPASPLDRATLRASSGASRTSTRTLPARPSIPSPLTGGLNKRALLSASTSAAPRSVTSSKPRPSLGPSVRPSLSASTSGPRPPSRGAHSRTSSRSGAMSPSLIPGPRRSSVSNGTFSCIDPSPSGPPRVTSRLGASLSRPGSRAEDRSRGPRSQQTLGRGPPPPSSGSGSAVTEFAPAMLKRSARRSSLGVVNDGGLPPSAIPGPRSTPGRPTSFPAYSDTPPPPVPRIPSAVLRDTNPRRGGLPSRPKTPLL